MLAKLGREDDEDMKFAGNSLATSNPHSSFLATWLSISISGINPIRSEFNERIRSHSLACGESRALDLVI